MHHSLVYFTVLTQTATGAFLLQEVFLRRRYSDSDGSAIRKKSLIVILSILIISLLVAFFHLGNPANSVNALSNIGTSWLSRELFSFLMFSVMVLICFIADISGIKGRFRDIMTIVTALAGIALLYSMVRLYTIPTVSSWYTPLTPVSFVLTSLICGLALLAVIYASHETFFPFFAAPLLLIFIVVSIAATILNYSPLFHSLAPYFLCRIVLSILVALFLLNKKLISQANKKVSLLVILLTALFLSEVIGRYIFFLSFEKSGL